MKQMTVCSNMHCYEPAEVTDDPGKPPFCDKCKKGWKVDERKLENDS